MRQGLAVTGEIVVSGFRFFAETLDALAGGGARFILVSPGARRADVTVRHLDHPRTARAAGIPV
jgi:hypothetical protein